MRETIIAISLTAEYGTPAFAFATIPREWHDCIWVGTFDGTSYGRSERYLRCLDQGPIFGLNGTEFGSTQHWTGVI